MPRATKKRPPGRPPRAGTAGAVQVSVRLTAAEDKAWRAAADDAGLTLAQWIRERCGR